MIIDFHTHTYPDHIAKAIVEKLSGPTNVKAYTDATASGLEQSALLNDIEKCVVLPVATSPRQTDSINRAAIETNLRSDRLVSFGAVHPDNDNYREILSGLVSEGVKGIKLHPFFQRIDFDDIRYMRIVDCACELGLIISVHAGFDINDTIPEYAAVPHIRNLLKSVKPDKMILAHMGGHLDWDAAEDMICEYLSDAPGCSSLYLDTAFSLPSPIASQNIDREFLKKEQFLRIVRSIGAEHVLFGTDSPWTDHGPSIQAIRESGLNDKEISLILYDNAKGLLS